LCVFPEVDGYAIKQKTHSLLGSGFYELSRFNVAFKVAPYLYVNLSTIFELTSQLIRKIR